MLHAPSLSDAHCHASAIFAVRRQLAIFHFTAHWGRWKCTTEKVTDLVALEFDGRNAEISHDICCIQGDRRPARFTVECSARWPYSLLLICCRCSFKQRNTCIRPFIFWSYICIAPRCLLPSLYEDILYRSPHSYLNMWLLNGRVNELLKSKTSSYITPKVSLKSIDEFF